MPETPVFGFLNINKPAGMTSHDVVAKIRRGLKIKKAGHAGTLDPLAEGVLVICLGQATRLSEYAMASVKRYRARVHLGIVTDTYDREGQIISEREASHITYEAVLRMLPQFTGQIMQMPPMYSAIKQGGRKLYAMARAGEAVERLPRPVTIDSISIQDWSAPQFVLDVVCSAGTYIRSLAYDVGEALGVGAHLAGLTRMASGCFGLEDAVSLDDLLESGDWQRYVLPPDSVLGQFPRIQLDAEAAEHVVQGRAFQYTLDGVSDDMLARAYAEDGRFIAILRFIGEDTWQPHKVFLR